VNKKIDKRKKVEKKLLEYVKLQANNKQVSGVRGESLLSKVLRDR